MTFNLARKAFSEFTLLHFPQDNIQLVLICDASNVACSAVLEQAEVVDGKTEHQPLGFYSAKFGNSQLKWSTYDKELYAIYSAIDHFHYMIEGCQLLLFTDHRHLVHMFPTKKRIKIERRSRWNKYIL